MDEDIEQDSPLTPLGLSDGVYYVLSGMGQLRQVSTTALSNRLSVLDLFLNGQDAQAATEQWLIDVFPKEDSDDWSYQAAAEWIMRSCAAKGLFNTQAPLRGLGVWRDDAGRLLANTGRYLVGPQGDVRSAGRLHQGVIYPAAPFSGAFPLDPKGWSVEPISAMDMRYFAHDLGAFWNWSKPGDAELLIGWAGCALLGGFTKWRPHLYVSGESGAGKTGVLKLAKALLSPLVRAGDGVTEASIRSTGSDQSRPLLFDEQERGADEGRVEGVLKLIRSMTNEGGGEAWRSTANHKAHIFHTLGAVGLFSIMPARMEAQDFNRFLQLRLLKARPEYRVKAQGLSRRAEGMGPRLLRRLLEQSFRWDEAVAVYEDLVCELGGSSRNAATMGALLAGRDLLLFDGPPDDDRLADARDLIQPLVVEALEVATEESQGEKCLRKILSSRVRVTSGLLDSISNMICERRLGLKPEGRDTLQQFGMRFIPAKGAAPAQLLIAAPEHAELNKILSGEIWEGGAHKDALLQLEGAAIKKSARIDGRVTRCIVIPEKYWPNQRDTAAP